MHVRSLSFIVDISWVDPDGVPEKWQVADADPTATPPYARAGKGLAKGCSLGRLTDIRENDRLLTDCYALHRMTQLVYSGTLPR